MNTNAADIRASRSIERSFFDRAVDPIRITPNKPIPCSGIQIAYIIRSAGDRSEAARATDAVVVIVNVAVAGLPFGVTELGDMLQAARAGAPLQLSLTGLVNAPPSGERDNWYVAVLPPVTVLLLVELVRLKSAPTPARLTT
jgi:hypothetical protein